MTETILDIVVRARDEAARALENVSEKLKDVQKNLEPAIKASNAFALALGAVTGVAATTFGVAIKAAIGAEKEMAVATQALKNSFDTLSDKTLKHLGAQLGTDTITLEDLKGVMEDTGRAAVKLGYDDETASTAFAKLFQATKDIIQTQKDVALAMDLAAFSGRDLGSATQAIMMVHAGGTRVLKEFGIEVKEGTTAMEALNLVNQKVQGSAETMASTTEGKMKVLKVQWDNLKETLGEKFLPVFNELLNKLSIFTNETLPSWIEKTQQIIKWLTEHKEVLIIFSGAVIGALIPALISLGITLITVTIPAFIAMAVALAPFILGGMIIAGVVAGVLWLIQNWELVRAKAIEIWEKIKGYLGAVLDWIKTKFKSIADTLKAAWDGLWNSLAEKVNSVWEGIKNTIKNSINWIIEKINGMIRAVNSVMSKAAGLIGLSGPQIPEIPALAAGGIVSRPTLAMIGEAGPEAVVPLSRGFAGAGVGGITININGGTYLSEDAALDMADKIANVLKLQLRT